jgi:2-amino-4-hydroxy-6-hydroxymethyldihydropteridine diphosphokinase
MATDGIEGRSRAFIGIGSNVEPEKNVRRAVQGLAGLGEVSRLSTLYRTRAIGPAAPDFINGVALLRTNLDRDELAQALADLEASLGRERAAARYAPRVIDLDLLLFLPDAPGSLAVPALPPTAHPDVYERAFVAGPLAEIDPDLVLSDGRSLREVAAGLEGPIGAALEALTRELRDMCGV